MQFSCVTGALEHPIACVQHFDFSTLVILLVIASNVKAFIGECKFVSDQASAGSFVNYNHHVISNDINGHSASFIQGDICSG